MTPHLTSACQCGQTISIECPTIADIPAAQAKMAGWGFDERGFVCCPSCLAAEPIPLAADRTDLFDGAAS